MQWLNAACVLYIEHNGSVPTAQRVTSLVLQQVRMKIVRKLTAAIIADSFRIKLTPAELEALKVVRAEMHLSAEVDNSLFRIINMNQD